MIQQIGLSIFTIDSLMRHTRFSFVFAAVLARNRFRLQNLGSIEKILSADLNNKYKYRFFRYNGKISIYISDITEKLILLY